MRRQLAACSSSSASLEARRGDSGLRRVHGGGSHPGRAMGPILQGWSLKQAPPFQCSEKGWSLNWCVRWAVALLEKGWGICSHSFSVRGGGAPLPINHVLSAVEDPPKTQHVFFVLLSTSHGHAV